MKICFDHVFILLFPIALTIVLVSNVNTIRDILDGNVETQQKSYSQLKAEYNELLNTRKKLVTQSDNNFTAARNAVKSNARVDDIIRNRKRYIRPGETFFIVRYMNNPSRNKVKAIDD